jgi:hypothetical protein
MILDIARRWPKRRFLHRSCTEDCQSQDMASGDAEAALRELSQSVHRGTMAKRSMQTLGDYLDEWRVLQEDRLSATTWHSDRDRPDQAASRRGEAARARTARASAVLRLPVQRAEPSIRFGCSTARVVACRVACSFASI